MSNLLERKYGNVYIAKVVNPNMEGTLHVGECTIRIAGIHDEWADDVLPVAIYFRSTFVNSFGGFPAGCTVAVELQGGDPNAPAIIRGRMMDASDKSAIAAIFGEYEGDYPNAHGWVDAAGNGVLWDAASGDLKVRHQSGFKVDVTAAGDTTIDTPGKLTAKAAGDAKIETQANLDVTVTGNCTMNITGTATITSTGNLTLTAPMIMEN